MNRLTLLLFPLLAMVSVAAAQAPSAAPSAAPWQPYVIKGEELSFELPQAPTASTIYRPPKNPGAIPPEVPKMGRMYGAYGAGIVYLVLSYENSKDPQGLDFFIERVDHLPVRGRTREFEHDLLLGGFDGKQYSFGTPTLSGLVQFYKSKKHVYVVYVVAAAGQDLQPPEIKRFLDSLSFASRRANYDPDTGPPPLAVKTTGVPPSGVGPGVGAGVISGVGQGSGMGSGSTGVPRALSAKDVSRKAIVVVKTEPAYTEAARRNQVTGTVVLKCIFASTGLVESIMPIKPLPFGLTESAVLAARQIRFIPALKDGKYVSQYIQLEYNFNLY